jgi:exosome complex component RRP42
MPSLTNSLPYSPAELAYLHTSLSSVPVLRPDARPLATDFRPLRAETGVLPAVNGSAHVGFSDGREAIVGVKLEVEKTIGVRSAAEKEDDGAMNVDSKPNHSVGKGQAEWVTLSLTLPGLRDDDANLVFLEEMLREPLTASSSAASGAPSLQDRLVINLRWHWHIYIDVLLISSNGLASYPLPLLSMATHLALRDTRVPRLKSEGEEDPVADDDWMASTYLYPRFEQAGARPPVTLLVVIIGDNIIFDPSREELAVADGIVAVSVGSVSSNNEDFQILATRMINTPARDTMKGVPMAGEVQNGEDVPGVWRPRVGGIKRAVLKKAVNAVIGDGVARDVLGALDGFLNV